MGVFLKTRDQPRRDLVLPAGKLWPANLHDSWGQYYRATSEDGGIWVRRSDFSSPPFVLAVQVTATGNDTQPELYRDFRNRLWLLFTRDAGGGATDIYRCFSDSDGSDWSTPAMAISGGKYSAATTDPTTGAVLVVAYVSGALHGELTYPGEAVPGETFTLKDDSNVDLAVADDTPDVSWSPDGQRRVLGEFHISGEGSVSTWESFADGLTWRRVS